MKICRIYKQGNSKAVNMPPAILKSLRWQIGDYLVVEVFDKDVVLSKLDFPPHIIKRISEKRQRVYEFIKEVK